MKRMLLAATAALAIGAAMLPAAAQSPVANLVPNKAFQLKTRLDHLSGTQWVVVVNYLPSEITSITCREWTMLGIGSWHHQNDFTIPAGPAIAIMDASKFDGYCKEHGSIVAHTDDGDAVGVLDRGDGNWNASTKLTFK